jgi:hypothetical protein
MNQRDTRSFVLALLTLAALHSLFRLIQSHPIVHRGAIIRAAAQYRVLAIYSRQYVQEGGLMSYGADGRYIQARDFLHRSHSERNQPGRFARPSSGQIRDRHQPQDREGDWCRYPAELAGARRRGDRMKLLLLRCTSPEVASLRHADGPRECPLIGVDRKSLAEGQNGAFDPQQTLSGGKALAI